MAKPHYVLQFLAASLLVAAGLNAAPLYLPLTFEGFSSEVGFSSPEGQPTVATSSIQTVSGGQALNIVDGRLTFTTTEPYETLPGFDEAGRQYSWENHYATGSKLVITGSVFGLDSSTILFEGTVHAGKSGGFSGAYFGIDYDTGHFTPDSNWQLGSGNRGFGDAFDVDYINPLLWSLAGIQSQGRQQRYRATGFEVMTTSKFEDGHFTNEYTTRSYVALWPIPEPSCICLITPALFAFFAVRAARRTKPAL